MQKCRSDVFEFFCKFKKPSGQDRTAAEGKFVAEATRRRRRILQAGFFFVYKFGELFFIIYGYINFPVTFLLSVT